MADKGTVSQFSPDLGILEVYCNKCGEDVPHYLLVGTEPAIERRMSGLGVMATRITSIVAECDQGHRQTVL